MVCNRTMHIHGCIHAAAPSKEPLKDWQYTMLSRHVQTPLQRGSCTATIHANIPSMQHRTCLCIEETSNTVLLKTYMSHSWKPHVNAMMWFSLQKRMAAVHVLIIGPCSILHAVGIPWLVPWSLPLAGLGAKRMDAAGHNHLHKRENLQRRHGREAAQMGLARRWKEITPHILCQRYSLLTTVPIQKPILLICAWRQPERGALRSTIREW